MAVSMISPKFYGFDPATGKTLPFGKVYSYEPGTSTPKATFNSEAGDIANTNPVILNAAGYADIYLDGSYKIVLTDADDAEIWTKDPVSDPGDLSSFAFNTTTETKTLASGQVAVTFINSISRARFYINGPDADNGLLRNTQDYSVDLTTNTITLAQSYPENTTITLVYNDAGLSTPDDDVPFETVAALVASSTIAGLKVQTKGYTTAGDGGQASYLIKTAAQAATDGDVIDGFGNHTLANGNVAILQKPFTFKKFGAKGDNATDSGAAMAAAMATGKTICAEGPENIYLSSVELPFNEGQYVFGFGAKVKAANGLEGDFSHKGVFTMTSISDACLEGVGVIIDESVFPDNPTNEPKVSAVKMLSATNCKVKKGDFVGGANKFFTPGFVFIGVIDMETCTNCAVVDSYLDGQYPAVNPGFATSTELVHINGGSGNLVLGTTAENAWSSGIVIQEAAGGEHTINACRIVNTKGSCVNMSSSNNRLVASYLEGSTDQGGVSIGEGATAVTGNIVQACTILDNFRAGIAIGADSSRTVIADNVIQNNGLETGSGEFITGIRIQGKNNSITGNYIQQSNNLAIVCHSTTLSPADVENNVITGNMIDGTSISIRAPGTLCSDNHIANSAGSAITMGFRCAGSTVTGNRSVSCLRGVTYSPNTGSPADYEEVQIHSNRGYGNTNDDDSIPVEVFGITGGVTRNRFVNPNSSLVLDDVLFGTDILTNDASMTSLPAIAGKIECASNSAFGDSYRLDMTVGYKSGGVSASHKVATVNSTGMELRGIPGVSDAQLIMNSPDGTRYKLTVSNAGALVITPA